MPTAVLLISCRDQPGLVHAVAGFVLSQGGNIVHAEQHIDVESGVFFQRVEFETADLDTARIAESFAPVADRFAMSVQVRRSDERMKVAVLASQQPHCLTDLLARWRSGELPADLLAVVSNHPDHARLAEFHGLAYHHLPVAPDTSAEQDAALLDALAGHDVELVVLARYMQILGQRVLDAYPARIINIHHSFLPAFVGANPYRRAFERGVKLIGATCHYATEDLDAGPIIEQEVARVEHHHDPEDLMRLGRDCERLALARSVRWHLDERVLIHGNKSIVFRD